MSVNFNSQPQVQGGFPEHLDEHFSDSQINDFFTEEHTVDGKTYDSKLDYYEDKGYVTEGQATELRQDYDTYKAAKSEYEAAKKASEADPSPENLKRLDDATKNLGEARTELNKGINKIERQVARTKFAQGLEKGAKGVEGLLDELHASRRTSEAPIKVDL